VNVGPVPQALDGTTVIGEGGSDPFGTTTVGQALTRTFTVTNNGDQPLNLGSLAVPAGFTITSSFGTTTVAAGASTTFSVQLNTAVVGSFGGSVSFSTNDPNVPTYRFTVSGSVTASTLVETVWVDDSTPAGATAVGQSGGGWNWVSGNPAPFSGSLAHQTGLAAGAHQDYFTGATQALNVHASDTLFTYVYLDPANPPQEIMLQWNDGSSWEHRAYWGADQITWGTDGTASRCYMGALPATGQWVRLEVPASAVGLGGKTVSGMAFTLYGGSATWDKTGKVTDPSTDNPPVADNDTYNVQMGTALTVSGPGVLANDTDPDGDSLTTSLVSGPSAGTLTFNADGSFSYTPNSGFVGMDSFTYRDSDGLKFSNVATVTLQVGAPPPPPAGSGANRQGNFINTGYELIPNFGANPTIVSVRSGNWSDPNTWSLGRVPTAGDVVSITQGFDVTYDVVSTAAVETVAIQAGGTLAFRTDLTTELTVVNLLVMPGGTFQIGTQANPVAANVKAQIVFPNVPLDTVNDPEEFGNGLIGLGNVTIYGAALNQTFVKLAGEAHAGDTTLTLATPVTGWKPGDRLELPDTRQMYWEISPDNPNANYVSEREVVTLAAISADGLTLTLSQPLQYDHRGARDGNGVLDFTPDVADLTRNVVIHSASATGTRGYTLFAGRANVDIHDAQFSGLGRTTDAYFDNTTFDSAGNVTHLGTNEQGRYPITFDHLIGPTTPQADGYQFTFEGNSVFCPLDPMTFRWAINLHASSYGLIEDNVLYNWAGGGIVADTGAEVGNMIDHNLVTRISGYGQWLGRADDRGVSGDFAFEGSAFWFRGEQNYVVDNVVSESRIGYTYYSEGQPIVNVPLAQGDDPSQPGQYQIVEVGFEPILEFSGNEVYGGWTNQGLTIWCLGVQGGAILNPTQGESVIKGFRVWNVYSKAYYNYDTERLTFDGWVVRGDWSLMLQGKSGATGYYAGDYQARDLKIINSDLQGLAVGFEAGAVAGTTTLIENTYFCDYVDADFHPQYSSGGAAIVHPRTTIFQNDTFALLNVPVQGWGAPALIDMNGGPISESTNYVVADQVYVYGLNGVATDNFQVFYNEQAASAVMPTTTYNPNGTVLVMGAPVSGLTNAQAWQQYAVAFAGAVAPSDASTRSGIVGLVEPL
jgi:hypothetical protein